MQGVRKVARVDVALETGAAPGRIADETSAAGMSCRAAVGPSAGRRLLSLAVGALALTLAACGPRVAEPPPPTQPTLPVETPMPELPAAPERTRVGLLLPLSGDAADIGQAMLNAAQMAVFDTGNDDFELLPRDTAGGAGRAAEAALSQGADLILGPLFATDVPQVRTVARSANIMVVAFTTDETVAGGNVLVMGILPSAQVDRVVGFTLDQQGQRIALLAPDNRYGEAVERALRDSVSRRGGEVTRVQRYRPEARDLSGQLAVLAEPDSFGALPFDALLIADGLGRLRSLGPALGQYDLDRVQLLGTGLWDDPEIGQVAQLEGGWFAAPDPSLRRDFEQRYARAFGQTPPRLATLAYDAVALAAVLATTPGGPRYDRTELTDPSGFAGVDGIFRFGSDGIVQRGLAVLEISPFGARIVDGAPPSFVGAAF